MRTVLEEIDGKLQEMLILTTENEELTLIIGNNFFDSCYQFVERGLGKDLSKNIARRFYTSLTNEIKNKPKPSKLTKREWGLIVEYRKMKESGLTYNKDFKIPEI
jgi:hypothetical protein